MAATALGRTTRHRCRWPLPPGAAYLPRTKVVPRPGENRQVGGCPSGAGIKSIEIEEPANSLVHIVHDLSGHSANELL
jgi:hypothetical protein